MVNRSATGFATRPGFSVGIVLTTPPFPYPRPQVQEPVGLPVLFDGELTAWDRANLHYCELGLEGGELVTSGIYGWAMVVTGVGESIASAQSRANGLADRILPFPLLGAFSLFLVVGGMVSLLFRYYIIPIMRMAESTQLISLSNPDHRVPTDGAREVAHLAGKADQHPQQYPYPKIDRKMEKIDDNFTKDDGSQDSGDSSLPGFFGADTRRHQVPPQRASHEIGENVSCPHQQKQIHEQERSGPLLPDLHQEPER